MKSTVQITPDVVVVANDSHLSTTLDRETVILHFDKGAYFGLNEVGTLIWDRLKTPHTVSQLCEAITSEYDVDAQRCEQDIIRLLVELHEAGLIEVRDAASK